MQAYLTIQQIRLSNKLTFTIDAPSYLLQYITVKLILQPLIENAIIHGFNASKGRGHLLISVSLDQERIELRISDNGSGSQTEVTKMMELLSTTGEETASFGIRNVNTRIKQWFGEQYGLRYESNADQGLTAIIHIPAKKSSDGLYNEQPNQLE